MALTGIVLGVLAGGRGSRMGGRDKGALPAPGTGEPLLPRLLRIAAEVGLDAVVVGGAGVPGARLLADEPAGVGPLGGFHALLGHAGERQVIALACDLPYLQLELLARLAREPSAAAVLAARDPESGKWQPLFARYDAPRVLPVLRAALARGVRSFQAVLAELEVQELAISPEERAELRDWDAPDDLLR
jgi:molybdopterin-guanine dinucleotide biosynthesis protein A